MEGVDAVLEEGAANLEELKVIWGDPDEPLDFDGFCSLLSWTGREDRKENRILLNGIGIVLSQITKAGQQFTGVFWAINFDA